MLLDILSSGYHSLMSKRINKTLRLDAGLDDKLKLSALDNGLSFNDEVLARLRDSFDRPKLEERIREIIREEFKKEWR